MSVFVETLRRNYSAQKITLEKIDNLFLNEKITQNEYDYIVS